MATSQLTIYSSSDASAPTLNGSAGSMLTVLDAVLVNGYGAKTAAGWSKPIANASNIGCYKNGAGSSQLNLVVNDAGVNATPGAREAVVTGWETLAGIATPVGSGTGQFPAAASLGWHKSSTADATARAWTIVADAHTCYIWMNYASTGVYTFGAFGDLFSLKATTDAYRCIIIGDTTNTNTINSNTVQSDTIATGSTVAWGPLTVLLGHYVARTWGGGGVSFQCGKSADGLSPYIITGSIGYMYGSQVLGPDNALYVSPLKWYESPTGTYRGRMRGLYTMPHASTAFADGFTFAGGGDYAGKTFQVIRPGVNGGLWVVETSNTVETN